MAKVNINLKDVSSETPTLIIIRFRYGQRRFVYSTGESIAPKDWNMDTQRARRSFPNWQALNAYLDTLAAECKRAYLEMKATGKPVTNKALKAAMDDFLNKAPAASGRHNLLTWAAKFMEDTPGAIYRNFNKHLGEFCRRYKASADFAEVDVEFFREFERYLRKNNLGDNYINRMMKAFKTVWKAAIPTYTKNRDLLAEEIRTSYKDPDNVYITLGELRQLYEYQFDNERLSKARDLLVAACLTGLRYSDWDKLTLDTHLQIEVRQMTFIEITATQKTGQRLFVPLLSPTMAILKKHNGSLPVISDQKARDYIREAAQVAGINEKVQLNRRRGGRLETLEGEKHEFLGTHTGRRSFNAYLRDTGMPDYLVKLLMGHTSKDMTDRYDKRAFQRIAEGMITYLEEIDRQVRHFDGDVRFL